AFCDMIAFWMGPDANAIDEFFVPPACSAPNGMSAEAESVRLANAGGRITLSMPDHSPFAHAFNELSLLTFIELLDDAAFYQRCFDFAAIISRRSALRT